MRFLEHFIEILFDYIDYSMIFHFLWYVALFVVSGISKDEEEHVNSTDKLLLLEVELCYNCQDVEFYYVIDILSSSTWNW